MTGQHVQFRRYLSENFDSYLKILERMVDINSFTANAEGVNRLGDFTDQTFAELEFVPNRFRSSNGTYGDHLVLSRRGRRGKNGPSLALVSHLDTVFPADEERRNDFHWRPEGDRIYGPGTVDIKGGTLIIFMMLSLLRHEARNLFEDVNWTILLNASEEVLAQDFGSLCREHIPDDALACLVFEGGRIKRHRFAAVTSRKGRFTWRIESKGRAAHAGSSHTKGANAVVQLARTLSRVAELTDPKRQITFNVATVAGGTVINRVPHQAVASGEARAYLPEVLDEGAEQLSQLAQEVDVISAKDGYPCKLEIEVSEKWAPWPPNEGSERLLGIWQHAGEELGVEVRGESRGGLSDGNQTWDFVPTLDGLGPAGGNAHCSERSDDGSKDQEFVWRESFVPKCMLNTVAIMELIRESGK